MPDETLKSNPNTGPRWWWRLLVFFGLNSATGLIGLFQSPGGSVQTVPYWIGTTLLTPLYAPAGAAFALGGILHSPIVFIVALVGCYIGALILVCCFFATATMGKWLLCCVWLIAELILHLIGLSVFTTNMQNWTLRDCVGKGRRRSYGVGFQGSSEG